MCGTPYRFNRLATFCPDNTIFTFQLPNSELLLRRPVSSPEMISMQHRIAITPRHLLTRYPARGRNYR